MIYEWNQRFLIPCITRENNNQSESSQIDQQIRMHEPKHKNSENMAINENNDQDKADKLVISKDDYQLDTRNLEVEKD